MSNNGNGNDEKEQVDPMVVEVSDDGDADTEFDEIPLGGDGGPDMADVIREAIEREEKVRAQRERPAIECFREITTDESIDKALNGKKLLGYAIILIDEDGQQTSAAFMPVGEAEGKTACGLIAGLEVRKFAILHHGIGS